MRGEPTLDVRRAYQGRLLSLDVLRVQAGEDGRESVREIVRHPGAVGVLARAADGRFLLVRQYRKPVEEQVTEIVAGCLEPGEDPAACARRELREETGWAAGRWEELGRMWPTPGYADECLWLFYAEIEGECGETDPDEDERVEPVWFSGEDLERGMAEGRIRDGKTLAAWLLYKLRMGGA